MAPRPKAFTMRFPADEITAFDQAILHHSARVGRRVDRTEAIRGLAHLFVEDSDVADRAIQAAVELVGPDRGIGI
jgi:hypothetical protein